MTSSITGKRKVSRFKGASEKAKEKSGGRAGGCSSPLYRADPCSLQVLTHHAPIKISSNASSRSSKNDAFLGC